MDAVNLAVGIVAIVLAVGSIFVTLKLSNDAQRSLDQAKATLASVEKATDNITRVIDDRLQDLINRAMPSQDDQMKAAFLQAVLAGNVDLGNLLKMAQQAQQSAKPGGASS